jgi:serine phosphatase RsbU (regulator of sigma subunit)
MNAVGELFGQERLMRALRKARGETLSELMRSVLDAVAPHAGGTSAQDDVMLLAIEVQ